MSDTINKSNIRNYLNKVVKIDDLQNIYDIWMILTIPKDSDLKDGEAILSFVGTETNEESDKLFDQGNVIIPIYNDSTEYNDLS